jgi:hypothetical protein
MLARDLMERRAVADLVIDISNPGWRVSHEGFEPCLAID